MDRLSKIAAQRIATKYEEVVLVLTHYQNTQIRLRTKSLKRIMWYLLSFDQNLLIQKEKGKKKTK